MGRHAKWQVLLILPFLGLLYPPLYATDSPELFGFPFFYWYQLAWVFLAAGLCALSFLLLKREREAYEHRREQLSADPDGGSR